MRTTELKIEVKKGLPNYSSRTVSAVVVADEDEDLDVHAVVAQKIHEIQEALGGDGLTEPPAPAPKKEPKSPTVFKEVGYSEEGEARVIKRRGRPKKEEPKRQPRSLDDLLADDDEEDF